VRRGRQDPLGKTRDTPECSIGSQAIEDKVWTIPEVDAGSPGAGGASPYLRRASCLNLHLILTPMGLTQGSSRCKRSVPLCLVPKSKAGRFAYLLCSILGLFLSGCSKPARFQ
jgi:hypothetical protein